MKILSIGNSFSQDAQTYVHQIAAADGLELTVCNLYYGGCSLAQHMQFYQNNVPAYVFERNGAATGETVTLLQGLAEEQWDFITLQQVSSQSTDYKTFQPELEQLAGLIRSEQPNARLLLHATWGYRPNSGMLKNVGFACHKDMYTKISAAYSEASRFLNGTPMLPSGKAVLLALQNGVPEELLYRDDIHLSLTLGRYLAGAAWYAFLTGRSTNSNSFAPILSPEEETLMPLLRRCADLAAKQGV